MSPYLLPGQTSGLPPWAKCERERSILRIAYSARSRSSFSQSHSQLFEAETQWIENDLIAIVDYLEGERAERIAPSPVRYLLKRCLKEAGIRIEGTPHCMRHICATHLLMYGADIHYVQELLGHESLDTTVVYTRQIVESLKKMHRMYHPRENELCREDI